MVSSILRAGATAGAHGFRGFSSVRNASNVVTQLVRRALATQAYFVETPSARDCVEARLKSLEQRVEGIEKSVFRGAHRCGWDSYFPDDNGRGVNGININQPTNSVPPTIKINFSKLTDTENN